MSDLSKDIAFFLYEKGYKWKVDGKLESPSAEDIAKTLDKMNARLDTEPRHSSIEVGRLLLKDNDEARGIYIYLGDYDG